MENFGQFYNITSKNETDFSGCAKKYCKVESAYQNSLHTEAATGGVL